LAAACAGNAPQSATGAPDAELREIRSTDQVMPLPASAFEPNGYTFDYKPQRGGDFYWFSFEGKANQAFDFTVNTPASDGDLVAGGGGVIAYLVAADNVAEALAGPEAIPYFDGEGRPNSSITYTVPQTVVGTKVFYLAIREYRSFDATMTIRAREVAPCEARNSSGSCPTNLTLDLPEIEKRCSDSGPGNGCLEDVSWFVDTIPTSGNLLGSPFFDGMWSTDVSLTNLDLELGSVSIASGETRRVEIPLTSSPRLRRLPSEVGIFRTGRRTVHIEAIRPTTRVGSTGVKGATLFTIGAGLDDARLSFDIVATFLKHFSNGNECGAFYLRDKDATHVGFSARNAVGRVTNLRAPIAVVESSECASKRIIENQPDLYVKVTNISVAQ